MKGNIKQKLYCMSASSSSVKALVAVQMVECRSENLIGLTNIQCQYMFMTI